MAVINNHSSINLDTTFQSNHTELLQFFYNEGLDKEIFKEGMKDIYLGNYENVDIGIGNACYSSCQWVATSHRGKKFGMCLDHLKKNIIFDKTRFDINYAIHKESFKDYHINGLHYSNSEKFSTIPNGDVGGAGEAIDKVYNIAWIEKDEWSNKQSEVRALYTS